MRSSGASIGKTLSRFSSGRSTGTDVPAAAGVIVTAVAMQAMNAAATEPRVVSFIDTYVPSEIADTLSLCKNEPNARTSA
ncbi:hypothetical protein GCM10010353_43970 [Streptomyces chryseus]|nr:hypothetical protein GCM10010353_43970 [Streptomyces chryseus]